MSGSRSHLFDQGYYLALAALNRVHGWLPFALRPGLFRLARFDIHPSGPLWGAGGLRSAGGCAETELTALEGDDAIALRTGLEAAGLKQERRALRLVAEGLAWQWQEDSGLCLEFSLPPGCYATALLQELGRVTDDSRLQCRSSESPDMHGHGSPAGV